MKGDYLLYKTNVSHECWRDFQIEYPDFKKLGMDYWTIRKILSDFCKLILEEVFNNPLGFDLPYNLGNLRMIGVNINSNSKGKRTEFYKRKNIDYLRTEGYVYGLFWLKHEWNTRFKNSHIYNFKTAKLIQSKITSLIREDKFFKWIKVDSNRDVNKMKEY